MVTLKTLLPEWAPQYGVLLVWPHAHTDFRDNLPALDKVYSDIVHAITPFEPAWIVCFDEQHEQHVKACLQDFTNCRFFQIPSNDIWARDFGPLSTTAGWLKFQFNGWGGKYKYDLDNQITKHLGQKFKEISFILEGGSIETDGQGTLLTTTNCLLNPNRNPDHSKSDIEQILKQELGVHRILWLKSGSLEGDDTDSHVDNLARFCDEKTICYTECSLAMKQELLQFNYHLVPLPLPTVIKSGNRLPASYANFLIINQAVLVPTFNFPTDAVALERIQSCFPERKIIGIHCAPLVEQHGGLHCATMQLTSE